MTLSTPPNITWLPSSAHREKKARVSTLINSICSVKALFSTLQYLQNGLAISLNELAHWHIILYNQGQRRSWQTEIIRKNLFTFNSALKKIYITECSWDIWKVHNLSMSSFHLLAQKERYSQSHSLTCKLRCKVPVSVTSGYITTFSQL